MGAYRPRSRTSTIRFCPVYVALSSHGTGCYAWRVIRGLCWRGGSMRTQRHTVGCVRFDKRRGTWNYLFYDHGKRRSKRIGTKREYPTKGAAWIAAEREAQAPVKATLPVP